MLPAGQTKELGSKGTYTVSGITYDSATGRAINAPMSVKPPTTAEPAAKPTPPSPKPQDPAPAVPVETEPQKSDPTTSTTPTTPIKPSETHLRYPYKAINPDTDYLKIEILEYVLLGTPKQENVLTQGLVSSKSVYGQKKAIQTILLPIPQNIQAGNSTGWGEDSLNSLAAYAAGAVSGTIQSDKFFQGIIDAIRTAAGDLSNLAVSGQGQSLTNTAFASAGANLLGGNTSFEGLLARSTGQILNPNKELLFNGVNLRSFNFSFDLAPRNGTEAEQILKIIRSLKTNMAPKNSLSFGVNGQNLQGLFLKSPNVFQLTYMSGGNKHPFLNSFIIAALTSVNVNYTGSGTYMTYNDKNKTPVHMKMDLSFQELSPVYAEDYNKVGGVGY